MSTVKEDVRYAESHEWVSVDGDIATIFVICVDMHSCCLHVVHP